MDNNRVGDSESEEELCYFYPDRVEKQPQTKSGVQFTPSVEKEATYSENDLPGPSAMILYLCSLKKSWKNQIQQKQEIQT